MIYITQLVFLKDGLEEKFLEFESYAIPLMEQYTGKMMYRIRPKADSFIDLEGETPYEVHFLSFDSEDHLKAYMNDDRRLEFVHLKTESIKSVFLVKGQRM